MMGAYQTRQGTIALGDVIKSIDGAPISNNDDYMTIMEEHKVGDTVEVVTDRAGKTKRFKVELTESQ